MKSYLFLFSLIFTIISCQSEAEKQQANADAMIAEAMGNAKQLEADALAKAAAQTKQVEADIKEKRIADEEAKQTAEIAAKEAATERKLVLKNHVNKSMNAYNGFYVETRNYNGALIFVDGKLTFFDASRFKTVYKNEEYNVSGVTADNYFDITAKYSKGRKGKVEISPTVLHDVVPTLNGGKCSQLQRNGITFKRMDSFGDFMATQKRYPLASFLSEFKAKYKRTDEEISEGMKNPNFYKSSFFVNAPFYGDHMPLIDALESIIEM
ncbi:MAG: hypothetical protein AB8G22_14105 [Saprospiraceae bacterium]